MDYRVLLHRTNAGRDLAERLDINAEKFAQVEHVDLTVLKIEDFKN
jgi:hypothetical protein